MLHPRNSEHWLQAVSGEWSRQNLCIKIIDVLDIEGSIVWPLLRDLRPKRVLLLLNKCDELPANRGAQIENYVMRYMRSIGMRNIVQCVAMSAEKGGRGVKEALAAVRRHRGHRDVSIVGAVNVGKSTFMEHLMQEHGQAKSVQIGPTKSPQPGTTLVPIKLRMSKGKSKWHAFDTPGGIPAAP